MDKMTRGAVNDGAKQSNFGAASPFLSADQEFQSGLTTSKRKHSFAEKNGGIGFAEKNRGIGFAEKMKHSFAEKLQV